MKQLKKLLSLVLMCALAMGLGVPAMAAVEDTGFSDVDAEPWRRTHGTLKLPSGAGRTVL